MARPRRTTRRPQNMGQNRNTQMRNNARRPGTFQGGVGQGTNVGSQRPGQPPSQGMQQCPPGQVPSVNPDTGDQICKPAQANIAGNVPVNNANRAIAPTPGKPISRKGY